ncbi:hypothetical protein EF847_04660 [Actinobacteria bacterium YIM 96077]|uniref:Uncharacterized protein n=1 Tax=Phytoactinopolyspora halophila TaxID=1981511 RepID=A0A329R295_9ACTN|nr:hypothetical protein EF847_04660 [Actinobacteria bacterium YIM 96077]RAW18661.1 hypothetical protein DPM12_00855 [Phytoactinopolyspora halophila]
MARPYCGRFRHGTVIPQPVHGDSTFRARWIHVGWARKALSSVESACIVRQGRSLVGAADTTTAHEADDR